MKKKIKAQARNYENKNNAELHASQSNETPPIKRSDASIGLGRLLSGARAATNGETVGAPLAAFAARGNLIFNMSQQTAVLPLTQAIAYVTGEPLRLSINRDGIVMATIYDYVFRTRDVTLISKMLYWHFVSTMEIYPLRGRLKGLQVSVKSHNYSFVYQIQYFIYFYTIGACPRNNE